MDELLFYEHLKTYLDEENIEKLKSALSQNQVYSSIILDKEKINSSLLKKIYPSLINHPVVENVFLFNKNELDLGKSILFELGAFYICEPCSSLVSHFLNPQQDDIVLDLAASPGGKTIHASFLMNNKGQIIANEISSSRAEILSQNIEKYGRKNVTVTSTDAEQLKQNFPHYFSKIILDAPCSGSGMFRKESKMKDDWTLEKVKSLSSLQKKLILDCFEMLKDGGELIYSTCSFSYEEDEEVIYHLLNNTNAELINLPHIKGEFRSSLKETMHLFPHLFTGEGHFIAKIRKPGILTKNYNFEKYKNPLEFPLSGQIFMNNKKEYFLTNFILPLKGIRVLRNGIKIGIYDKKIGWIYDHALSRYQDSFLDSIELSLEQLKEYLYGLSIKTEHKNGYVILTYLSIPFSLGKVSNKQIKNHYPKGLRKKF